jgi:hypothetical protein
VVVAAVDHGHRDRCAGQRLGGGKPAEAGADDDHARTRRGIATRGGGGGGAALGGGAVVDGAARGGGHGRDHGRPPPTGGLASAAQAEDRLTADTVAQHDRPGQRIVEQIAQRRFEERCRHDPPAKAAAQRGCAA